VLYCARDRAGTTASSSWSLVVKYSRPHPLHRPSTDQSSVHARSLKLEQGSSLLPRRWGERNTELAKRASKPRAATKARGENIYLGNMQLPFPRKGSPAAAISPRPFSGCRPWWWLQSPSPLQPRRPFLIHRRTVRECRRWYTR
jgi:hypothetical protein